jgi:aminopeptidase S
VALAVALVLATALPSPVGGDGADGASAPDLAITEDQLGEHLDALQGLADASDGTRADGTPGFAASVDYVTARLEAAGYDVVAEPVAGGVDPSDPDAAVRSTNIVADWKGTSDEVVVVGAHLDSVSDGPGMNDNGSGVAGVLEIAEQLAATGVVTEHSVRFAFWGAEEVGLLGSGIYVESLSRAERDRTVAYLNADMIGSTNYVRGVYDPVAEVGGDDPPPGAQAAPGSAAISRRFYDHFDALGLPTVPIATDGESDDAAFAAAGIPTGGVFTGAAQDKTVAEVALFGGVAGEPTDPCYHRPCDDLDNVDLEIAAQMAQALGAVALGLAGAAPPNASSGVRAPRVASAVAREPSYVG